MIKFYLRQSFIAYKTKVFWFGYSSTDYMFGTDKIQVTNTDGTSAVSLATEVGAELVGAGRVIRTRHMEL